MSGMRYTEEFKREAVAQITDRGHSVRSVLDKGDQFGGRVPTNLQAHPRHTVAVFLKYLPHKFSFHPQIRHGKVHNHLPETGSREEL